MDGFIALGGTVTFVGSPCFSGPIPVTSGAQMGKVVYLTLDTANGSFHLHGDTNDAAISMGSTYSIVGGACDQDAGWGTLTKQ